MRTLVVFHLAQTYGPVEHVRPWLAALAKRGELHTVLPAGGPAARLYAPHGDVSVLSFEPVMAPRTSREALRSPTRFAREVRGFRQHIRRVQPELVVVVTSVLPAAVVAARLEKVPTVVYAAEILRGERFRNAPRAVAAGLLRSVVARADAVICCSQAVAAQFSRRPTTIVQVIYPGVGSGFDAGNRNAFREAHALRDADPCLAVVGNLTQGRGQDLVLKALPSLRHIFPHVRLMVAGPTLPRAPDMRYERALKQLADELGVSEAVAFVGPTDRVADVYAASDIVVNPVRVEEALGRVALEALAAGRPVIATRRGAIPEVLRDGQDALLIDAEDPAAIAAAVRTLWADRALRERLVRTGRSRVAIEFDVKRSVDKFTTLIDEVLLHARFHARSSTSPNKSE